jgi:hypothetical protein
MNIDFAKLLPLAFGAALMLGGCQHLHFTRVYDQFKGLGTVADGKSLDVLVVHGMGQAMEADDEQYSGYSIAMQKALAPRLGFATPAFETTPFPIDQNGVRIGSVQRTRYRKINGASELTFYELSWAEAVKPLKIALLELGTPPDYRETSPLEDRRARLNSKAKAFLNTHPADAVIYSGELGATLRQDVEQTICIMTRVSPTAGAMCDFNAPEKQQPLIAVISRSLGSALVFDTLYELGDEARAKSASRRVTALNVAAATTHVFMLANQMPLLELAQVGAPSGAGWLDEYPCPADTRLVAKSPTARGGIAGFLKLRAEAERIQKIQNKITLPPPFIVAFSDPNDLLTYFITKRFREHCAGAQFANVAVTNADTLWFFVAADPVSAHTGYSTNGEVIRMIVEGANP